MLFLISECCMSCHALCFWMNVCRAAVACFSWMPGCSLLWPIIPWSALTALHLIPYPASSAPWSHDHLIYQSRKVDLGNVLLSVMRQWDCLMTSVCLAVLVPLCCFLYRSKKDSYIMDYDCVSWYHVFKWYWLSGFVLFSRVFFKMYLKTFGFRPEYFSLMHFFGVFVTMEIAKSLILLRNWNSWHQSPKWIIYNTFIWYNTNTNNTNCYR